MNPMPKASKIDNLVRMIQENQVFSAGTLQSLAVDLDIPRGMMARIRRVILRHINISEDMEGITTDIVAQLISALVRDPDDQTTVQVNSDGVNHDMLFSLQTDIIRVADGSGASGAVTITDTTFDTGWIPDELDIITVRNLRLNSDAFGTDIASITESACNLQVFFTYEKVSDADVMEILGVL